MASLRGQRTSKRGQGPSQLITNFCNTVWHNFYTHLMVCPTNFSMYLESLISDNSWSPVLCLPSHVQLVCPSSLSMYLEQLITDNHWSPVCVSLPPLLSIPPPPPEPSSPPWPMTHLPSQATWYILNEPMHNFNDGPIYIYHDTM